jgi:hypothetical protein
MGNEEGGVETGLFPILYPPLLIPRDAIERNRQTPRFLSITIQPALVLSIISDIAGNSDVDVRNTFLGDNIHADIYNGRALCGNTAPADHNGGDILARTPV